METRTIGSLSGVGRRHRVQQLRLAPRRQPRATRCRQRRARRPASTSSTPPTSTERTSSEEFLGRSLGARRDEAVIATKFGMPIDDTHYGAKPDVRARGVRRVAGAPGHRPHRPLPAARPRRHGAHRRHAGRAAELVAAGKVREIGCSNLTAAQLREARAAAGDGPAFVSVQNQYSLLAREPETRRRARRLRRARRWASCRTTPWPTGCSRARSAPAAADPRGHAARRRCPPSASAHWLSERIASRVGGAARPTPTRSTCRCCPSRSRGCSSHAAVASVIAGASNPDQVAANANAVTSSAPT